MLNLIRSYFIATAGYHGVNTAMTEFNKPHHDPQQLRKTVIKIIIASSEGPGLTTKHILNAIDK